MSIPLSLAQPPLSTLGLDGLCSMERPSAASKPTLYTKLTKEGALVTGRSHDIAAALARYVTGEAAAVEETVPA
jgi:hypothetical protein